jgi:hypothetical protein
MHRLVFAFCMSAVFATVGIAEEAPISGWKIRPHADLHSCTALPETMDTTSYGFNALPGELEMVVIGLKWQVKDGIYPLQFQIDQRSVMQLQVEGGGNAFAIPLSQPLQNQLSAAKSIHIQVDGKDFASPVNDLQRVMDGVLRCVVTLPAGPSKK